MNGIYMFYQQDKEAPSVEPDGKYYISDIYLQHGKNPSHCIALLEAQDTPINVNLSPDYEGAEGRNSKYIGYKVTKKQVKQFVISVLHTVSIGANS